MTINFVINPRAGKIRSRCIVEALRREFDGFDLIISSMSPQWPSAERRRGHGNSGPRRPDLVVAVGGDGTVNQVINAVRGMNLPVGIIPLGSSNDLAGALGIPLDFERACAVIRGGRLMDIDLVSVNGALYATCGGLGVSSRVVARANAWRQGGCLFPHVSRALGRLVYPLAALRELCSRSCSLKARIRTGDGKREGAWFNLFISNQSRFGGFCASPSASNRDGLLDICEMKAPPGRLRLFWISLLTYLGRPDVCPEVAQRQTGAATIITVKQAAFFGDGEILVRGRFFRVQVQPRALQIVVPLHTAALAGKGRGRGQGAAYVQKKAEVLS